MGFWSAPQRDPGSEVPSGRGGHGSVALGGDRLLVFGGADRSPQGFNDLWLLELREGTEQWTKISPKLGKDQKKLIPRSGCSLTLVNGKVYIYGGQEPVSGAILDELLVLETDTWELHPAILAPAASSTRERQQPPARHSHVAGIFEGDSVIVFGGAGLRGPLNDVWQFNTVSLQWRCLSEGLEPGASPIPREMAAGCVISEAGLFVHGGRGPEGEILSDVAIFDGRASKWVLIQSTPYARCAHTATNAVQQQAHGAHTAQQQEQQPSSSGGDMPQLNTAVADAQQPGTTEAGQLEGAVAEQPAEQTQQQPSSDDCRADTGGSGSSASPAQVTSNVLLYGGFTGEAVSGELLQLSFLRHSYVAGGASLRVGLRPVKAKPPGTSQPVPGTLLASEQPPRFAHSASVVQREADVDIVIFGGVNQTDDLNDVVVWTL